MQAYRLRFRIKIGNEYKFIPVENIAYFYSKDHTTYIVTHTGLKYILDMALTEIITLVDPFFFFQINRWMIVSINSLKTIYIQKNGLNSIYKLQLSPKFDEVVFTSKHNSISVQFKKWLGYPAK